MALKLSSSELPQTPKTSTLLPAGKVAKGEEEAVAVGDTAGDPVAEAVAVLVGVRDGLLVAVEVVVVGAVVTGAVVVGVDEVVLVQEAAIISIIKIPRTIRDLPKGICTFFIYYLLIYRLNLP